MNLVTVNTAELIGPALDWAVAHATKAWEWAHEWHPTMTLDPTFKGVSDSADVFGCVVLLPRNPMRQDFQEFTPSINWAYGGPLIDKYRMQFATCGTGPAMSGIGATDYPIVAIGGLSDHARAMEGATHLIAAMRCIVASQLGDTVQVPEELLPPTKETP